MKDIEVILGEKVSNIRFLTYQVDSNQFEIEKVLIEFKKHHLLLEIDTEYDQIIPRLIENASILVESSEHKIIDISEESMKEYECILNSKLIWFWEMTNNQGYFDAVQLEFENNITFQFLVECSFFKNSKLNKILNTAANRLA